MVASETDSNRRVRTRTHGGVAGVRRQLRPLCRSCRPMGRWLSEHHPNPPRTRVARRDLRLLQRQRRRIGRSAGTYQQQQPGAIRINRELHHGRFLDRTRSPVLVAGALVSGLLVAPPERRNATAASLINTRRSGGSNLCNAAHCPLPA
jgi:hypothetical protein